jgi:hypothetical protein
MIIANFTDDELDSAAFNWLLVDFRRNREREREKEQHSQTVAEESGY